MTQSEASAWRLHMSAGRLLASAGLLVLCILFRRDLTQTMALHMLIHLPAIFLAGAIAAWPASGWRRNMAGKAKRKSGRHAEIVKGAACNEQGIAGLLLVTLVLAYWMIPKALDDVLVSEWAHLLKFASLFLAGMVLSASLPRAQNVVKLFFLGNFSWMTAIVGILYQEHATRLCNFYLLGDQALAGMGLVAYAVILPIVGLAASVKG